MKFATGVLSTRRLHPVMTQHLGIQQLTADNFFHQAEEKYKKGDFRGALIYLNQSLRFNPIDTAAYYNRGLVKRKLGDTQGAIADYNQALRLNPNNAATYYNRGNAKRKLGDQQGSKTDLQKAAHLYHTQGNQADYQDALEKLRNLPP